MDSLRLNESVAASIACKVAIASSSAIRAQLIRVPTVVVGNDVVLDMLLLGNSVPGHDALVGLLVLRVAWVERVDGIGHVGHHPLVAASVSRVPPVVEVPASVEGLLDRVVPEEHVLRVVVDQVALRVRELELTDEARNSELLDNLQDIELRVEARAGLGLQLVLLVVPMAAAAAPGRNKVLLTAEAPKGVAEGFAAAVNL